METSAGTDMGANKRTFATRLFLVLIGMVAFFLLVHLLLQYLNLIVFKEKNGQIYELSNRFDLDDEISVPTWFSQVMFLVIAACAVLAAYLEANKPARRLWVVIAAIGLLFSLDEVASLHEFVLQSLHVLFFKNAAPSGLRNAWWIILPFVVLAGAWLIRVMFKHFPRRTVLMFAASGIVFLTGAIFIDILANVVPRTSYINQGLLVGVEETMELMGSVVVVYAIAEYVESMHKDVIGRAVRQLKK